MRRSIAAREYFGLRTVADPRGRRDPAILPAPGRVRAVRKPGRGDRVLSADVLAGLSSQLTDPVQLRHPAHPDVVLLPDPTASCRSRRHLTRGSRPVGLGVMGLQDAFFTLRLPFDSAAAMELSTRVQKEIFLTALETSAGLAEQFGPHPAFSESRAAAGELHPSCGAHRSAGPSGGRRSRRGSPGPACATRCSSRSRRPRPSRRSPVATSASSRRSPTSSNPESCEACQ
jgi:hypothetical protein